MNCLLCKDNNTQREATQMLWMIPVCDEHDSQMREPFDLSREGTKLRCNHCHEIVEGKIHICFQ
jgi:hypothetical protein